MLWIASVLLAYFPSQAGAALEPSIEQQLDALIVRTNALDSFHVRYRATFRTPEEEPEEGWIDFAYAAPDRGAVRGHVGELSCEILFQEEELFLALPGNDGDLEWKKAALRPPDEPLAARRVLEEHFPARADEEGRVGMLFGMTWGGMPSEEGFSLTLTRAQMGKPRLLGWLSGMKAAASDILAEGDVLVWSGEGFLCRLSCKSGFPVRLEADSKDGRIELDLEELRLDEAVDGTPFEIPAAARAATVDPRLSDYFDPLGPMALRGLALGRLAGMLKRGERAWNDETKADLVTVLEAIHRERLPEQLGAWMDSVRHRIGGIAERIASEHSSGSTERAALEKKAGAARQPLEASLAEALRDYEDALPKNGNPASDGTPRAAFFEAEHEAVRLAFDEVVGKPLLAFFDEKVGEALGN